MMYTKFQQHWPIGSKEEDFFKGFYPNMYVIYIIYDQNHLNKLSFSNPKDDLHEI